MFDEQFKLVSSSSGFEQVPEESYYNNGSIPNNNTKLHVRNDMPISKSGFLYIYVSNETPNIDVFFDNLQVTHIRGQILEETHYYPFGLVMAGISSKAAGGIQNKTKYNGKELQSAEFSDGSGLELYDYGARIYDAQIGRWHAIDPKSELYIPLSTYQFCLNNPVNYYDSDGRLIRDKDGNIVFIPIGKPKTENHPTGFLTYGQWGYVYANDGKTAIKVFKNLASNTPEMNTNCIGTTFGDGKYWILPDDVRTIIEHDGYKLIDDQSEKILKGDVVIYVGTDENGVEKVEDSRTVFSTENDKFEDILVYGQGGLEKENSEKNINEAWVSPTGKTGVYIWRKTGEDKKLTDQEIEERKKTKSDSKSRLRLLAENQ